MFGFARAIFNGVRSFGDRYERWQRLFDCGVDRVVMLKKDKRWAWFRVGMNGSAALIIAYAFCAFPVQAQKEESQKLKHQIELLAKAAPDECFVAVGEPSSGSPPCQRGQPKVNDSYIWSMTSDGEHIWLGTVSNYLCGIESTVAYSANLPQLGPTFTPHQTSAFVCESIESGYPDLPPGAPGDWRPPRVLRYHPETARLEDFTPLQNPLLYETLGLRSAFASEDVVIYAGQRFDKGVNLFAFDTVSGALIATHTLPELRNMRQWIQSSQGVYVAGGKEDGHGLVFRWNGTPNDPFLFEVVAELGQEAAYLAEHEGRLFANTWPVVGSEPGGSVLYMSPLLGDEGLNLENRDQWQKVWQASDYDPDPVIAQTYFGGAMASYGGYLYWSTMHLPGIAPYKLKEVYGEGLSILMASRLSSAWRSMAVFRGRNFSEAPVLEPLYADDWMSVTHIRLSDSIILSGMQQSKMGPHKFGRSGFDRFFNVYGWSMAVYDNRLYVGTYDFSYELREEVRALEDRVLHPWRWPENQQPREADIGPYGADLMMFPSPEEPAVAISEDGLGNYANIGIRNMLVHKGVLYVATANPFNLLANPDDDQPEGGWELIAIRGYPHKSLGQGSSPENNQGSQENDL